jgi:excisionase family DNA binding protein
MTSPYLTIHEAIAYLRMEKLGAPVEMLQRLCRTKKLKGVKRGRTYLFKPEWLEKYLERN